jgi:hypothetical protein
MEAKEHVVVTGGGGFLGSNLRDLVMALQSSPSPNSDLASLYQELEKSQDNESLIRYLTGRV